MNKPTMVMATFTFAAMLLSCSPAEQEPRIDQAQLREAIQEKTERLYWIHLRLDTASTEISNAQTAAQEGNLSAVGFHAAEAYRALERADQAVLELGEQLQKIANLDQQ